MQSQIPLTSLSMRSSIRKAECSSLEALNGSEEMRNVGQRQKIATVCDCAVSNPESESLPDHRF